MGGSIAEIEFTSDQQAADQPCKQRKIRMTTSGAAATEARVNMATPARLPASLGRGVDTLAWVVSGPSGTTSSRVVAQDNAAGILTRAAADQGGVAVVLVLAVTDQEGAGAVPASTAADQDNRTAARGARWTGPA